MLPHDEQAFLTTLLQALSQAICAFVLAQARSDRSVSVSVGLLHPLHPSSCRVAKMRKDKEDEVREKNGVISKSRTLHRALSQGFLGRRGESSGSDKAKEADKSCGAHFG